MLAVVVRYVDFPQRLRLLPNGWIACSTVDSIRWVLELMYNDVDTQRLRCGNELHLASPLAVGTHTLDVRLKVLILRLLRLAKRHEGREIRLVRLEMRADALAVAVVSILIVLQLICERPEKAVAVALHLDQLVSILPQHVCERCKGRGVQLLAAVLALVASTIDLRLARFALLLCTRLVLLLSLAHFSRLKIGRAGLEERTRTRLYFPSQSEPCIRAQSAGSSSSSSRSTRRETRTNLLPAAGTRDTIGLAPRDDNERSMQMPKVV